MLPRGVRVEGRAVLEVDLLRALRAQPAQRGERLRDRLGRRDGARLERDDDRVDVGRERRRPGTPMVCTMRMPARTRLLARSVAPVKSSAMQPSTDGSCASPSASGSSMPGKILITALSSSLAKPAVEACMNIWCAVRRERQRKLAGARRVEHQAEVLDEDVDRRQRRVVAGQHVRHAVLEHPAVAGAVRDDLVQRRGVDAFAQAQRHRLGGGGDVHAGQQLVDDLHLAAGAGAVAEPVDLGRPSRRARRRPWRRPRAGRRSSSSSGPRRPWPRRRRSARRGRAGPAPSRRASSAIDQFGSTVEHITKTLPGRIAAARAVASPNSTASVCAALTTTETTHLAGAAELGRGGAGDAALAARRPRRAVAAHVAHVQRRSRRGAAIRPCPRPSRRGRSRRSCGPPGRNRWTSSSLRLRV